MRGRGRLQFAAVVGSIAAYSALSHYSNSHPQASSLATALAIAPMLMFGLLLCWRARGPVAVLIAALAAALFFYLCWPHLTQNFRLVYLLEQAGFYTLIMLTFGGSLLAGRVPLCTQLADRVHGPLSAVELRYTRQVTVAWTVFFAVNLAVTLALFAWAPIGLWSLFVNFCALPLVALMFMGEYAVRRRVLPQVERSSTLTATLRAFFASPP
jgi:uncharacterized membrane protein